MHLMTITLNECCEHIFDRLDKVIDYFEKQGIVIEKEMHQQGKISSIQYTIKPLMLQNDTILNFEHRFKEYIANVLSDIIIDHMEESIAYKILSNSYYYFGMQERKSILKHLKSIQENEVYKCKEGVICTISRKSKIFDEILNFLRENNLMNVEGFLRFRLTGYMEELENNIDKAVEDFLMEKEYNEFIRLLRYFVDIQEAKIDTVNVLMSQDGKYHLYDKGNRMINNEYLEDLATEMEDKNISYDDLLISSLITLAPKKIIIHFTSNVKKKEIIETIQNVFSDRVYTCSGCELCMTAKNIKQE